MADDKVKPSERSKVLSKLETPEEVQKDIQRIYSDARKLAAAADKSAKRTIIDRNVQSIKRDVDDTASIKGMSIHQVSGYWQNAFTLLENVKKLVK